MKRIIISQKVVERCKIDEMVTKKYAKALSFTKIEIKMFSEIIEIPIIKDIKASWIDEKPQETNIERKKFNFTGTIEYAEELDNFDNEILTKIYYYEEIKWEH